MDSTNPQQDHTPRPAKSRFGRHRAVVAGVAVAALLGGGGAFLFLAGPGEPTEADLAQQRATQRETDRGFTEEVTVPVLSPDQPRPAEPRPPQLPPLIKADPDCKQALDPIRDIVDRYPSGLIVPGDGLEQLTSGLAEVDRACPADVAIKFRQQELSPWQTWQVPDGYQLPTDVQPAPAATAADPDEPTTDADHPATSDSPVQPENPDAGSTASPEPAPMPEDK